MIEQQDPQPPSAMPSRPQQATEVESPSLTRRSFLGAGLGLAAAMGGRRLAPQLLGRARPLGSSAPSEFVFTTWGAVGFYQDGYKHMQQAVPQYAKVPFVSHEAATTTAVREDIITGFVSHNYSSLPDVTEVAWSDLEYLASNGTVVDLTERLKPYTSQMSPAVLDVVTVNGRIMACPWRPNTALYWYNNKVLSEAGIDGASLTTYDAYIAAGKKLAAYKFPDGKQRYINSTNPSAAYNPWFLTQQGATLFDKKGNLLDFRKDSRFQNSMEVQVELAQAPLSMSVNEYEASWFQALKNGTLATVIIPNWFDQELREDVTQGKGDWRVAPLPAYSPGGGRKALTGAAMVVALNKPGLDLDLAWAFMQKSFYDLTITPEVYTTWYLEPCWYPVEDKVGYHTALPYYGGQNPGAVDVSVQQGAYQENGSVNYSQVMTILSTALAKAIAGTPVSKATSYAWDTMMQQRITTA
jgi:lactose/L-arabinose transport system substrate-binding protein